ncbi:hypothetical protein LCGC14_0091400 [marine sediment metagenome]|uniref:Uncharacterized protein n=1 Tax=marine sediment metagenome TaxID=412755 RepID=A0A0F9VUT4_9ZZZZ
MKDDDTDNLDRWHSVKAFAVIVLISITAYKIAVTPFNFVFDFPSLLSLLLAFFSVGLAALFYFKATETSNTFYDNTYKFTREIAQLITKMESGFGERLRHLDEGYSSVRDHIQRMPSGERVREAQKKLEEGEETLDKTSEERNALIMQLIDRAHLQEEEKTKFMAELRENEEQLKKTQNEMAQLKRRVTISRMKSARGQHDTLLDDPGFIEYTEKHVLDRIWHSGRRLTEPALKRRFSGIVESLEQGYVMDLNKWGVVDDDNELTDFGASYLQRIRTGQVDVL